MADYDWAPGQVVFEPNNGWGGSPGDKRVIDRVTPSGRAVIGASSYDKKGRVIGGSGYRRCRIEPFTEEHAAEIALWGRRVSAGKIIESIKWRDLTPLQLDALEPALTLFAEQSA